MRLSLTATHAASLLAASRRTVLSSTAILAGSILSHLNFDLTEQFQLEVVDSLVCLFALLQDIACGCSAEQHICDRPVWYLARHHGCHTGSVSSTLS